MTTKEEMLLHQACDASSLTNLRPNMDFDAVMKSGEGGFQAKRNEILVWGLGLGLIQLKTA
jgi:hypothetical protein